LKLLFLCHRNQVISVATKNKTMKTKELGSWGKISEVNNSTHITQTNANAKVGKGVHVSTCIPGTQVKVRDYFDANGRYQGSSFGKNG